MSQNSHKWEDADYKRWEELRSQGYTWDYIGRQFGKDGATLKKAYSRAKLAGKLGEKEEQTQLQTERTFKENTERGEASLEYTTSTPVKTLEDALEAAEIDLSLWEVHSWEYSAWTTPLNVKQGQEIVPLKKVKRSGSSFTEVNEEALKWRASIPMQQQQYRVALKLRRKSPEVLSIEGLLKEIENSGVIKIPVYHRKPAGSRRRALEISIMDPHLGLQCFQPAADTSWSLDEAETAFMDTLEQLLHQAKLYGPFEKIVCPIGNDYFHSDNLQHTTTKGTIQPESVSYYHTLDRGERLMFWKVERLREEAPLELLSIPGNHDGVTSHLMARIVRAYYQGAGATDVTVDASPSPYKFWSYGVNLIGFEHGHSIKPIRLAALMANETRLNHWQNARYCEWHLGDQHRKGSGSPVAMEEQGVSVEYLPSLTPPNEWHRMKSYNWQKRGAMAFVYDYESGPLARLQVNFDSYTGKHMGKAA